MAWETLILVLVSRGGKPGIREEWISTLLAHFEEFVSLPSDDSAGESAPAPFDHTTQHLTVCQTQPFPISDYQFLHDFKAHLILTTGSTKRSSCINSSPRRGEPLCSALKKLRMNDLAALGSELGRKGSSKKGVSNAVLSAINVSLAS